MGWIRDPSPGAWVASRSVRLSVTFRDSDGILPSSLSATLDGVPLFLSSEPWDANWTGVDVSAYSYPYEDGPHVAEARASDLLGNGPTVLTWSFTVDATPPVLNITSPVGNPVAPDGNVILAWTGMDNASGIDHYLVRLDDGPYINVGTVTAFPFHGLPPGVHYFYVVAYDRAGNSNLYSSYNGNGVAIATVPAPPAATTPPANVTNSTTQVIVVVPNEIPSWVIVLVAMNVVEAAAVVGLAMRRGREPRGGGEPSP